MALPPGIRNLYMGLCTGTLSAVPVAAFQPETMSMSFLHTNSGRRESSAQSQYGRRQRAAEASHTNLSWSFSIFMALASSFIRSLNLRCIHSQRACLSPRDDTYLKQHHVHTVPSPEAILVVHAVETAQASLDFVLKVRIIP